MRMRNLVYPHKGAPTVPAHNNACGYEGKMEGRGNGYLLFAALDTCIFLLEFLNTPRGINQFLLSGEIRMTGGTNLDSHLFIHGSEFDLIAASTNSLDLIIFWMGIWFHDVHSL